MCLARHRWHTADCDRSRKTNGDLPDGAWVAVMGDGRSNERTRNKLTLFPTGPGTARTIELPIEFQPCLPADRAVVIGGDAPTISRVTARDC